MNMLPGYTDSFIDPVTGVLASENSLPNLGIGKIWTGGENGRPTNSSVLLDLKIDINSIFDSFVVLTQHNALFPNSSVIDQVASGNAKYILQTANQYAPNAQALDQLTFPLGATAKILKAEDDGVVSVAIPDIDYATAATLEATKNQAQAYANQAATSAEEAAASAAESATSAEASEASAAESATSAAASEASALASAASAAEAEASAVAAAASATAAEAATVEALAPGAVSGLLGGVIGNIISGGAYPTENHESLANSFSDLIGETNISLTGVVTGSGKAKNDIATSFSDNPTFTGNVTINNGGLVADGNGSFSTITTNYIAPLNGNLPIELIANAKINSTGYIQIPSGNSSQRPSIVENGMMRLNTETGKVEIVDGLQWRDISPEFEQDEIPKPYINELPINGDVNLLSYSLRTYGALYTSSLSNHSASFNIDCKSPLLFNNLPTSDLMTFNTSQNQSNIVINNTNSYSDTNGICFKKSGYNSFEVGFDNRNNEAYLWSSGNISFGAGLHERLEITNDNIDAKIPISVASNTEKTLLRCSGRAYENNIILNNDSPWAKNTTLLIQRSNKNTLEVGFNNSNDTGFVGCKSSLEFATNFTKRMEIAADSADLRMFDNNHKVNIRPNASYLNLRNAYVMDRIPSTVIETNAYETFWGNTASIVMNGHYIQYIANGFVFTHENSNPETDYSAYMDDDGSWITSSSKEKKYSKHKKHRHGYLDRLNQLNIYSYGLKREIKEGDDEMMKQRKYFQSKQMQIGVLAEEVASIFGNATNKTKLLDINSKRNNEKEFKKLTLGFKPKESDSNYLKKKNNKFSLGVNYQTLLCYTILALQELTEKVQQLEKKYA